MSRRIKGRDRKRAWATGAAEAARHLGQLDPDIMLGIVAAYHVSGRDGSRRFTEDDCVDWLDNVMPTHKMSACASCQFLWFEVFGNELVG